MSSASSWDERWQRLRRVVGITTGEIPPATVVPDPVDQGMIVSSNHAAQKLWREINGPDVDPDSIAQPRHYTAELVRRAIPRILEEERRDYRDKVKARIIAAQGDYGWNALAHYFDD